MKLFSKITTLLLLMVMVFLAGTELIYAQNTQDLKLPNTIINPGSFYYPFKRLVEKGRERVIFSEEGKISFYTSLLRTRLSELDYVTEKKVLSEIQGSSERFAYQAGILTEELIQSKSKKKKEIVKEFEKYGTFLGSLRDRYPANSSFWMLVQHDINTLSILSGQLK